LLINDIIILMEKPPYSQYTFFWGEKNTDGFMSNFYPCVFSENNYTYNCSEQYFMKKKQELFDPTNEQLANAIMNTTDPKEIKKYGRAVKNYNESVWNTHRITVMFNANKLKFSSNSHLREQLIATGNKILVEASPYDNIWGIGLAKKDAITLLPTKWPGQNLLGKVLMKVRDEFTK